MCPVRALLVSTYDLGRQPFGLASPAAWLRRAGVEVRTVDVSRERLVPDDMRQVDLAGFYLPMHTATRLAAPIIRAIRANNPTCRICAYGVYAPLNAEWLRGLGVDDVLGGEFEEELAAIATSVLTGSPVHQVRPQQLPRIHFLVPDRTGLPPLSRYATLQLADGTRRTVAYTEASRGCRHLCRHCPIVPVYNGQFRVVQPDVVLADIEVQIAAGARHVTFGDPDFFNGPTHAMRIVDALHAAHPTVTYDVTIKVEHLLQQSPLLPRLRATGCLFVTSAVESLDDRVLALLQKGHTRADFVEAVERCRRAGLTLAPTFVAFHPWTTVDSYCDLLDTIEQLALVDQVSPIQLAIRLLVPAGSRMLELEDVRHAVHGFDPATLTHRWSHADPAIDRLHREISSFVGSRLTADRGEVFEAISEMAHERCGIARTNTRPARSRATVPYLNEPWYC
jgi:radical SAM superfamily enzyme YgiQ (UPF0313 family)